MKTSRISLRNLHNEEHFQFHSDFKNAVVQYGADALDILEPFHAYTAYYNQEQESLQLIRKSANTEKLAKTDMDRDNIFRGFADAVKSGLNHFDGNKQAAAGRIQILLDQYGNVARKPYDEETAALTKLVTEMNTTYQNDISLLALADWVQELDAQNKAFDMLMKARYSEGASQTELRMVTVRVDVDAAYKSILDRLDALMLLNGASKYEAFVKELNERVNKYSKTLSMRRGRAATNKEAAERNESENNGTEAV